MTETRAPDDLPADVSDLATLELRAAQVQDWSIAGDSFTWTLLAGDTERGHELATVTYVGAVVLHTNRRDLDRAVAAAAEVEHAEIGRTEDGGFEHRVTLVPAYPVVVRFWSVEVRRMPHPTTCAASAEQPAGRHGIRHGVARTIDGPPLGVPW